MFKLFWNRVTAKVKAQPDWRHDPLGHPALRAMSLRELADLPVVAEVPMRVGKVEVTARPCQGASQELSYRCAVSR
jgi:hypothetical protein